MKKIKNHRPDLEIRKLHQKLAEIREQQTEVQENICNLAYTISLQLQLLEEFSQDLDALRRVAGLKIRSNDSTIVHLKEYLEKIPR